MGMGKRREPGDQNVPPNVVPFLLGFFMGRKGGVLALNAFV
jgi:hypothetical protein